jgi:hypothetical protein
MYKVNSITFCRLKKKILFKRFVLSQTETHICARAHTNTHTDDLFMINGMGFNLTVAKQKFRTSP